MLKRSQNKFKEKQANLLVSLKDFFTIHVKMKAYLDHPTCPLLLTALCTSLRNADAFTTAIFQEAIIPHLGDVELFYLTQALEKQVQNKQSEIFKLCSNEAERRFGKETFHSFLEGGIFEELAALLKKERLIIKTNRDVMQIFIIQAISARTALFNKVFLEAMLQGNQYKEYKTQLDDTINGLRPKSSFEKQCIQYRTFLIEKTKKEFNHLKNELIAIRPYYQTTSEKYQLLTAHIQTINDGLLPLIKQLTKIEKHQEITAALNEIEIRGKHLYAGIYVKRTNVADTLEKIKALHAAIEESFYATDARKKRLKVTKFIEELREKAIFKSSLQPRHTLSQFRFWTLTQHDKFLSIVAKEEQKMNRKSYK